VATPGSRNLVGIADKAIDLLMTISSNVMPTYGMSAFPDIWWWDARLSFPRCAFFLSPLD
jgi:hypothetical protein